MDSLKLMLCSYYVSHCNDRLHFGTIGALESLL